MKVLVGKIKPFQEKKHASKIGSLQKSASNPFTKTSCRTLSFQTKPKSPRILSKSIFQINPTISHQSSQFQKRASFKAFALDSSYSQRRKYETTKILSEFKPLPLKNFISKYNHLQPGQILAEETPFESVVGRVYTKRESSRSLNFYTLARENEQLQVIASKKRFSGEESEFASFHGGIGRGDVVSVAGLPGRTKTGELSLYAYNFSVLSKCLHNLPNAKYPLSDPESRYRKRFLDLLVNSTSKDYIIKRSQIIQTLRRSLLDKSFIEVETPILSLEAGGAVARPFQTTHSVAFSEPLSLRISPELYLKKLIIGGFDKVFEIGKLFRNEGVDHTHYPEFTSCEFYQAYATYKDLMPLTEEILRSIAQDVFGTLQFQVGENLIDFEKPFAVIDVMLKLKEFLGTDLPNPNDPNSLEFYLSLLKKHNITLRPPHTLSRAMDKLIEHFLEPLCIQPTFLIHQPLCLSPLAKASDSIEGVAERFELFVGKTELCNAYSELTDPEEQRFRFSQQKRDAEISGDVEIPKFDEKYCQALEYGLPPTAGWGIGLDRLTMMLTGATNIKEVLTFTITKDKDNKNEPEK